MNCSYGILLDFFLAKIGDLMNNSAHKFGDLDRRYFTRTRGKLSENEVSIFFGFILYDKVVIYLVKYQP